jgi:TolB-like protein/Flp pilus assembly protein TadD
MDRMIIAVLALALVYFAFDRIVLAPRRQAVVVAEAVRGAQAAAPDAAVATAIDQKSVAVLPFVNMSGEQAQEYFSDGISEEILNALAQVQGLKVVGRTSSFKFKGHNEDLRRIGEQLGVAHLLEGSVRKQGDSVRITAQLIKAQDGFHLWSKTFDRKLTDVFAIQDEISAAIAGALSVRILSEDAGKHDADPVGYDLYLRARQLLALRTGESVAEAVVLFEAATIIDAKFDAAHAGLARALSLVWNYSVTLVGGDEAPRAVRAAKRALELNPRNAEAHSALGYVQTTQLWDWDAALRETRVAIELAPNDAEVANFAGDVFRETGDLVQGEHWERRAIELDPLLPVNRVDLGWVLLGQRRCREAIEPLMQARAMVPDGSLGLDALARAYLCLGDFEVAAKAVEQSASAAPMFGPDLRARLAIRTGRRDDALAQIGLMQARAQAGESLNYVMAQLFAMLGDYPAAAKHLSLAIEQRDPGLVGDELWVLPEDWPDDPAIRAALDHPSVKPLFEMRRGFIQSQKLRVGHD